MASLSTPEDQKHFERSTEEVATTISSPVFILSSHRAVTSATPPSGLLQRRCNASVQPLFRTAFCSAVDSHCPLFRRASAAVSPYFCRCSASVPPRSSSRHPASVQPCSVACSTFCSAAVLPLFSLHSAAVQPPSSFKVPAPSHSSVDFQKSLSDDFSDQLEARIFKVSGCKKLHTLGAEFAWNYSNLTTTNISANTTTVNGALIEIFFQAKRRNYKGWLAWGMNPGKKPQMLGAKAIIAIKHKRTTDVHTYEVTKETSKGCRLWPKSPSEFGLNVLDMQAWSNNTKQCTTLYAKLILPFPEYNISWLNHV